MTEFRKLSERIADDIHSPWYCCCYLPEKKSKFFKKWFMPTVSERMKYNHMHDSWMSDVNLLRIDNNNLRILALLFAEQLWNDIKEGER